MRTSGLCVALGLILAVSATASATISYDAYVTPDVIFGSGNGNGYFTVDTQNNVEIGLRAKLRKQGVYNSGGDGSYSFATGYYPADPTDWDYESAIWNFEWTVNTDLGQVGTQPGRPVNALTYKLGLDFDPGIGTNYLTFDPINLPFVADNEFGTNATANGGGVHTTDLATYTDYLSTYNVVQQSWNMEWFDDANPFDATNAGTYEVYLAAFDGQTEVARSAITVEVGGGAPVPEPITMAGLFMGVAGLAGYIRKRRIA